MSEFDDFSSLLKDLPTIAEAKFEIRICSKCGIKKPYDEYSFCSRTKADIRNGVRRKKAQCRSCDSKETTAHRNRNIVQARQKDREQHYQRKYGVSKELSLVLADPNVRIAPCPICHQVEKLVLDHDHNTKKVRELICPSCNSLLGYASENIDTLYNAIAYLKKHRGV